MNFEEFLTPEQRGETQAKPEVDEETVEEPQESVEVDSDLELDVQKVVVESLAAEKAEQEEHIASLRKTIVELRSRLAVAENQLALKTEEIAKFGDLMAKNSEETQYSNKVALLDRNPELDDHFIGETRDHVIEALKEARDRAEQEGRNRHAQILEAVLAANEPEGTLAERRQELINIFNRNGNIVSGQVIAELIKLGISHKNGENYLLPKEIINRNY